jgi:GMP synthase-like glutamine amidotransferase
MKLGILETGDVAPELKARHGDYPAMFRALLGAIDPGMEFATVRVVAGEMPATPGQADAWLVTGSRHGIYDGLPWIEPLKAFLRAAVAAHVPVVGICFGHQILAEALGGRAVKSDRGWGLGTQDYTLKPDAPHWMQSVPERFSVRALHQDQVVELPPGAHVLASSPHCAFAALAYGDPERPEAISLQPHPEFGPEFMDELLALRSGTTFAADLAGPARASLARPAANEAWARAIVDYLHAVLPTAMPQGAAGPA